MTHHEDSENTIKNKTKHFNSYEQNSRANVELSKFV